MAPDALKAAVEDRVLKIELNPLLRALWDSTLEAYLEAVLEKGDRARCSEAFVQEHRGLPTEKAARFAARTVPVLLARI